MRLRKSAPPAAQNTCETDATHEESHTDNKSFGLQELRKGFSYKAKLIGSDELVESRGDKLIQEKLTILKKRTKKNKPRIVVHISINGIRIVEEKDKLTLHEAAVNKITFIARDELCARSFAFILSRGSLRYNLVSVKFERAENAAEVTLIMKQLFVEVSKLRSSQSSTPAALLLHNERPVDVPISAQQLFKDELGSNDIADAGQLNNDDRIGSSTEDRAARTSGLYGRVSRLFHSSKRKSTSMLDLSNQKSRPKEPSVKKKSRNGISKSTVDLSSPPLPEASPEKTQPAARAEGVVKLSDLEALEQRKLRPELECLLDDDEGTISVVGTLRNDHFTNEQGHPNMTQTPPRPDLSALFEMDPFSSSKAQLTNDISTDSAFGSAEGGSSHKGDFVGYFSELPSRRQKSDSMFDDDPFDDNFNGFSFTSEAKIVLSDGLEAVTSESKVTVKSKQRSQRNANLSSSNRKALSKSAFNLNHSNESPRLRSSVPPKHLSRSKPSFFERDGLDERLWVRPPSVSSATALSMSNLSSVSESNPVEKPAIRPLKRIDEPFTGDPFFLN